MTSSKATWVYVEGEQPASVYISVNLVQHHVLSGHHSCPVLDFLRYVRRTASLSALLAVTKTL